MARVPYLELSDLSAEDQDLLKRRISLFQALVNSPKAARAFSESKQTAQAVRLLRRVVRDHAGTAHAEAARRRLVELGEES